MAESFFRNQPHPRPEARTVTQPNPAAFQSSAGRKEDYSAASLTPGENVLYRAHLHALAAGRGVGAGIAFVTFLFAASLSIWGVFVAGLLIGALTEAAAYMRVQNSEFTLTDRRVLAKVGWISRRSIEILLTKIESVAVEQGIMARMFAYGTVVVIGTGGTREVLPGITSPFEFRKLLLSRVTR